MIKRLWIDFKFKLKMWFLKSELNVLKTKNFVHYKRSVTPHQTKEAVNHALVFFGEFVNVLQDFNFQKALIQNLNLSQKEKQLVTELVYYVTNQSPAQINNRFLGYESSCDTVIKVDYTGLLCRVYYSHNLNRVTKFTLLRGGENNPGLHFFFFKLAPNSQNLLSQIPTVSSSYDFQVLFYPGTVCEVRMIWKYVDRNNIVQETERYFEVGQMIGQQSGIFFVFARKNNGNHTNSQVLSDNTTQKFLPGWQNP